MRIARVAAVAVASVCVAGALMLGPQLLRALSSGGAFLSHVSMFVAASAATFVLLRVWEADITLADSSLLRCCWGSTPPPHPRSATRYSRGHAARAFRAHASANSKSRATRR